RRGWELRVDVGEPLLNLDALVVAQSRERPSATAAASARLIHRCTSADGCPGSSARSCLVGTRATSGTTPPTKAAAPSPQAACRQPKFLFELVQGGGALG